MHECGNLIQHEGEARGLYAVTARGHYPYTTGKGGLTGLYPTVVTSTSVVSGWAGTVVVSCTTGKYHDIALAELFLSCDPMPPARAFANKQTKKKNCNIAHG